MVYVPDHPNLTDLYVPPQTFFTDDAPLSSDDGSGLHSPSFMDSDNSLDNQRHDCACLCLITTVPDDLQPLTFLPFATHILTTTAKTLNHARPPLSTIPPTKSEHRPQTLIFTMLKTF